MKNDQWSQLCRQLKKLGYTLRIGGSGHIKVYDGDTLVTVMPNSATDWRAIRNKKAELKRRGIVLT